MTEDVRKLMKMFRPAPGCDVYEISGTNYVLLRKAVEGHHLPVDWQVLVDERDKAEREREEAIATCTRLDRMVRELRKQMGGMTDGEYARYKEMWKALSLECDELKVELSEYERQLTLSDRAMLKHRNNADELREEKISLCQWYAQLCDENAGLRKQLGAHHKSMGVDPGEECPCCNESVKSI